MHGPEPDHSDYECNCQWSAAPEAGVQANHHERADDTNPAGQRQRPGYELQLQRRLSRQTDNESEQTHVGCLKQEYRQQRQCEWQDCDALAIYCRGGTGSTRAILSEERDHSQSRKTKRNQGQKQRVRSKHRHQARQVEIAEPTQPELYNQQHAEGPVRLARAGNNSKRDSHQCATQYAVQEPGRNHDLGNRDQQR